MLLLLTYLIETTAPASIEPARVFQCAVMALIIAAVPVALREHFRWLRGE